MPIKGKPGLVLATGRVRRGSRPVRVRARRRPGGTQETQDQQTRQGIGTSIFRISSKTEQAHF